MILEYGLAIFSEYVDKVLRIAAELHGPDGSGRSLDPIQPLGLLARPRDPDADAKGNPTLGAGVLYSFDGNEGFAMPTTDPRALAGMPPEDKGDTQLYSTGEKVAFVLLKGLDGGLLILCPSDEDGKRHAISIDPTGKSIQINHSLGMGLSLTGGGKNSAILRNAANNAYIEVNDDGITLNGNVNFNGGCAMGPGSVAVATIADLAKIQIQIAALLSTAPGSALGGNVPAVTPGSSKLSAAL